MRSFGRVLPRTGTALAVVLGLVAAPANIVAAAARTDYVNMGDSYSAGSGVPPPALGSHPACTQSARNWAHDIAGAQSYDLNDVSCGGAKTEDYTGAQFPGTAPQLDALSPAAELVTMTIGGNDGDLFADTVANCSAAAATTAGRGSPCKDTYGDTFTEKIATTTYPNLVKTLREVKAEAPNAEVAIAGYLHILPPTQGCYPIMPVASGDVPYLNHIQATLNDAVERAAAATAVTYVDVSEASAGHDACQQIGTRWIEPAVGSTNYIAIHPNALGEHAMADRTTRTLGLH